MSDQFARKWALGSFVGWAWAIFAFMFAALMLMVLEYKVAALWVLSGLVVLPPAARFFSSRFQLRVSGWVRGIVALALVIVSGAALQHQPKPSALPQANTQAESDVQSDDTVTATTARPNQGSSEGAAILATKTVVVQNCIANSDEIIRQNGASGFKNIDMCLIGYSQNLQVVGFDVAGISPGMDFDTLAKTLKCSISYAQTGAFGAPGAGPQSRGMRLSCVGQSNGHSVWYSPALTISDSYRRFIVDSADFEVCGPDSIVKDGQTYNELVRKFGEPVQKTDDVARGEASISNLFHAPINTGELYFAVGAWSISARTNDAEDHASMLGCDRVLHIEAANSQAETKFLATLGRMDQDRAATAKPNF